MLWNEDELINNMFKEITNLVIQLQHKSDHNYL